jgi:hypothetical protein
MSRFIATLQTTYFYTRSLEFEQAQADTHTSPEDRRHCLGGRGGVDYRSPVVGVWRWSTREPTSRGFFRCIARRSAPGFGAEAEVNEYP